MPFTDCGGCPRQLMIFVNAPLGRAKRSHSLSDVASDTSAACVAPITTASCHVFAQFLSSSLRLDRTSFSSDRLFAKIALASSSDSLWQSWPIKTSRWIRAYVLATPLKSIRLAQACNAGRSLPVKPHSAATPGGRPKSFPAGIEGTFTPCDCAVPTDITRSRTALDSALRAKEYLIDIIHFRGLADCRPKKRLSISRVFIGSSDRQHSRFAPCLPGPRRT